MRELPQWPTTKRANPHNETFRLLFPTIQSIVRAAILKSVVVVWLVSVSIGNPSFTSRRLEHRPTQGRSPYFLFKEIQHGKRYS